MQAGRWIGPIGSKKSGVWLKGEWIPSLPPSIDENWGASIDWEHIIARHEELDGHLDNVLDTLRLGKRRQDKRDPQTYTYYRRCEGLIAPYDHIIVAIAFRFHESNDGTTVPNNFVVSAWGKHIPSKS